MSAEEPVRIDLLARSSSRDEPYHVTIQFHDNRVMATCDCQAGIHGRHCKHRMAVARGDSVILYNPDQFADLARASNLLSRTEIRPVADAVVKEQDKVDEINRKLKVQKALLARLMTEGAPVDEP